MDKNLYKPGKNNDIGMGAKLYVSTYKSSSKFKESTLKSFLDGVRRTLSGLVEHMLEKSPLPHCFTGLAGAISPNIIAIKSNRGSCEAKMAKLLLKLVTQEKITVKEGAEAKEQFSKVINDLATAEGESYFNKFTDRLDTFYAKLSMAECSALSKVFVITVCMFHGQSAVERGFNNNADMVADNQSDHSLMALHIVHDHTRSYEVCPHDMKVHEELCQSAGKSRQHYQECLEEEKKQKKQTEKYF